MRQLLVGLTVVAWSAISVAAAAGQQTGAARDTAAARRAIEQRAGRAVSQAEILDQIRQSGMTRAQLRARLQAAGYDPAMADRYFDILERGGEPPRGEAQGEFVEALGRIGVSSPGTVDRTRLSRDSLGADSLAAMDPRRVQLMADTLPEGAMEVFGLRVFRRAQTQFDPVLYGPVDAGYRLGPGDEIQLVITGDVEVAYTLEVSREGFIFIPDVGQLLVNGLTLGQLDDRLFDRLRDVYSSISRSPNARTRFNVSVGRLRSNQIFVTGDVELPGSYQVSSAATVFNALYQAGGPTEEGSFRRVEVHRGGQVVFTVDLYDYLVRGAAPDDIRLQQNDRVFVPPAGTQVQIEGSVRRPAIYEVLPNEGLREALSFAAGLRSDALVRRVQIDRIIPPAMRQNGRYRELVDVDLADVAGGAHVPLVDGDVVTVFAIVDERRNRLWLDGEVRNPGIYEWSPGTTLWGLIERADGLAERAYTPRAHVYRLVETDGSRRLLQVSLVTDAGTPLQDIELADNDSVVVFSREELRQPEFVSIDGYVKNPDDYPLARGMTLRDLVLAAGGFIHGAYVVEAEVTRMPDMLQRTDTTAYVIHVALGGTATDSVSINGVPYWLPQEGELELVHGDRVFIRRAPGYEMTREVYLTGEVKTPGAYVLARRDERLVDVLARAGGLTENAFRGGIHVKREGRVVAADPERALADPRDRNNIPLVSGDSIHVPAHNPTVTVAGAVNFQATVVYVPGRSVDYYLNQAGGLLDSADDDRITLTYMNGERTTVKRGVFERRARVQPGSQIYVPAQVEDSGGVNWDSVISRSAALLGTIATVLLAVSQLR
jgi:polysaccharide export outer membrane protein